MAPHYQITVRLSEELDSRLRDRAADEGVSVGRLIRSAIEEFLDADEGPRDRKQPEGRAEPVRAVQPSSRASAGGPPVGVEPATPQRATVEDLTKIPGVTKGLCPHAAKMMTATSFGAICDEDKGGCGTPNPRR